LNEGDSCEEEGTAVSERELTRRQFVWATAGLAAVGAGSKAMGSANTGADAHVHVWEKHELTFTCERTYVNAYTDAIIWVDLTGPGFNKRVYGF
jgi:hypothetical protein